MMRIDRGWGEVMWEREKKPLCVVLRKNGNEGGGNLGVGLY
jgi:hypothetical protein